MTFRKVLFWMHLSVGCMVGLVIAAMSVTGILLAYERQITTWADAPAVTLKDRGTAPLPLDAVIAKLMAAGYGVPDQLTLHHDNRNRADARYGREKVLFVNLQTGDVTGESSKRTRAFFAETEQIHRFLGLGFKSVIGKGLTGLANAAFLFMLLSGLFLWFPKIWSASSLRSRLLLRRGVTGRAREWNLHNVIGIWALLPLLLIVITGVVQSYPQIVGLLYRTPGGSSAPGSFKRQGPPFAQNGRGHRSSGNNDSDADYGPLNRIAAAAAQQDLQWKTVTIPVSSNRDRALVVSVDRSPGGMPEKVSRLTFDEHTGVLIKTTRFMDSDPAGQLRARARFLHTGEEFGVPGQTVAMLASLGAILLVWSGLSMALGRLRTPARVRIKNGIGSEVSVPTEHTRAG